MVSDFRVRASGEIYKRRERSGKEFTTEEAEWPQGERVLI